MIYFVVCGFVVLTALLFVYAIWPTQPTKDDPPARGRTLVIEWNLLNASNVPHRGQVTLRQEDLRQLTAVAAAGHTGPLLKTVIEQATTDYNELIFTSFPPVNPLGRAQAEAVRWIVALIGNEFHLVHESISQPYPRLVRIFAR